MRTFHSAKLHLILLTVTAIALLTISAFRGPALARQLDSGPNTVNICDRTEQVRAAILADRAVTTTDCALVSADELAQVQVQVLEEKSSRRCRRVTSTD